MGLVPSREATTADPVAPFNLSSRKISDGLATSLYHPFFISKIPISLVEPNLFLTARKILNVLC